MLKIVVFATMCIWYLVSVAGLYGVLSAFTRKDRISNGIVTALCLIAATLLMAYWWSL